jgi:hypothetical protein
LQILNRHDFPATTIKQEQPMGGLSTRAFERNALRRAMGMAVAAFLFLPGTPSRAVAGGANLEYQVKAVFLFNFAKFVDWPGSAFSGPDAPIVIGVVGQSPFGDSLETAIKGETVKGRKLVLRQLSDGSDLTNCHILFISRSERDRIPRLLAKLGTAPVLTVADSEGFTDRGGMINFVLQDKNIRFEIDPEAAERAGLKISARLLKLPKPSGGSQGREGE